MREVYFVEGAGLIKIGVSTCPMLRFSNMLTSCPIPLSLLASMPAGPDTENKLHRQFADQRAHGEWFHPSDKLRSLIAAAPIQYGARYRDALASLYKKAIIPPEKPEAAAGRREWTQLLADLSQ